MKLSQTDSIEIYNKLSLHVQYLLNRARKIFGNDDEAFVLFLAYLVSSEEYNITIKGMEKAIQLLLKDVHNFWFDNEKVRASKKDNYQSFGTNNEEIELKRNVVKYIILDYIEAAIKDPRNNDDIVSFIKQQRAALDVFLDNKETELNTIFKQNTDFANIYIVEDNTIFRIPREIIREALPFSFGIFSFPSVYFYTAQATEALFKVDADLSKGDNVLKDFFEYVKFIASCYTSSFLIPMSSVTLTMYFSRQLYIKFIRFIEKKHSADWTELNLNEFKAFTYAQSILRNLKQPKEKEIDSFWLKTSLFSEYSSREPLTAKMSMETELNFLKSEIEDPINFIRLLTCLIFNNNIPPLQDIGYSVPVDLLHEPQKFWLPGNPMDLHDWLLYFFKKTLIDYVSDQLTNLPFDKGKKEALMELLKKEDLSIKEKIDKLEPPSLRMKSTFEELSLAIYSSFSFVLSLATFFTTLTWCGKRLIDEQDIALNYFTRVYLPSLSAGLAAGAVTFSVTKKTTNFITAQSKRFLMWKNTTTSEKFIKDTFQVQPQLSQIFTENTKREIPNNNESGRKLKMQ